MEAIILYILLFLSGTITRLMGAAPQASAFSPIATLTHLMLYIIPSLALIWYIICKSWKLEYWLVRPGKKDVISGLITLPCLILLGSAASLISLYIGDSSLRTTLHSPTTVSGWIILSLYCIFFAYLEESFFRFYLLGKRKEMNLGATQALILSVILFSLCHLSSGPWGFLNAALCGALLGFMFLRYNSLHGIAVAHGLYNIASYVLNALTVKT
ncbi:MAG: CPBP family intramembrane metalloprotease [Treponema sp.]|nr:CPBP family intramembrane metalloprotease [Treponema sp.]